MELVLQAQEAEVEARAVEVHRHEAVEVLRPAQKFALHARVLEGFQQERNLLQQK